MASSARPLAKPLLERDGEKPRRLSPAVVGLLLKLLLLLLALLLLLLLLCEAMYWAARLDRSVDLSLSALTRAAM